MAFGNGFNIISETTPNKITYLETVKNISQLLHGEAGFIS
jgi:hypothetical protein